MKILLTNDDGIYAEGLWAVYREFAGKDEITVVAPDRERSAVGHGITLYEPLRTAKVRVNGGYPGYAVSGTPADCVKLGLQEIVNFRPDIVISGINPGSNIGVSINYSGTVAAAKEAALYGIPAVAVSVHGYNIQSYDTAASFTEKLARRIFEKGLPFGTFLNVNIPNIPLKEIAGIRISRQNVMPLSEYFEKRVDPRNRPYHWLGGDTQKFEDSPDIDGSAVARNYISVTPLKCDATDYNLFESLKDWNIDIN